LLLRHRAFGPVGETWDATLVYAVGSAPPDPLQVGP